MSPLADGNHFRDNLFDRPDHLHCAWHATAHCNAPPNGAATTTFCYLIAITTGRRWQVSVIHPRIIFPLLDLLKSLSDLSFLQALS